MKTKCLIRLACCAGFLAMVFAGRCASTSHAAGQPNFQRDVRPILSDHCFACHGPDTKHRKADLRFDLDAAELLERGVVNAKEPEQSELMRRILSSDPDEQMPPPGHGKPLTAQEIETLQSWLASGASWGQHWAFRSPERAAVPRTQQSQWARNTIDDFVLAKMESKGLHPSPRANPAIRLRRLCLDLTGLPPTIEQLNEFQADPSDAAYEAWVDRLLASPHFGERMTLAWLDQARYADTNGYSIDGGRHMSLWRDWVIDAYNRNLPFDQFLLQQMAGDLVPNATPDQVVATGFHRNHMITHEGGTIPAENLVNYAADRVKTTGEVFLGLTLGCAQCHDHKFDPITQRDYYRLFAYFNELSDRGLDGDGGRNAAPTIMAHSVLGRDAQHLASLRAELTQLEAKLREPLASQSQWEAAARDELSRLGENLQLHPARVLKVSAPNRTGESQVLSDGTVYFRNGSDRSPSIATQIDADNVTALRLEFLPDEHFPQGGLGHGNENGLPGSFLLTAFNVSATTLPADQVDLYRMVKITKATASASHPAFPPEDCLEDDDSNGWSPHPHNQQPQHITFHLAAPLNASETPFVTFMVVWGGGPYGGGAALSGGKYRLFAVTGRDEDTNVPPDVQTILKTPVEQRDVAQGERVREYYASIAPETANVRYRIENIRNRIQYLTTPQPAMVMDSAQQPRETHLLNRGQYDQPGERVTPGTPASLLPPLEAGPPNRLSLARWMLQPNHPLTSRVAVNRLWQLVFGTGIVSTSADFGSQGSPPTHPELLDWLAIEFIESGWDVKDMLKRMVMSSTYQQSSTVNAELLRVDPTNQWLARGPRFRLSAEVLRDHVLATSGLLVDEIGGPSVKPYQPPSLWKELSHFGSTPATAQAFVQDHGSSLYRRSLYTFWKRTSPPPAMTTFDAPNREICAVQRSTTNTPLQALVLLNDPQFVEASRFFATRILREAPTDADSRLRFAFRLATAREPNERELAILRSAFQREQQRFANDPAAAADYLTVGEGDRERSWDAVEQAAWSSTALLILNLSETITRG